MLENNIPLNKATQHKSEREVKTMRKLIIAGLMALSAVTFAKTEVCITPERPDVVAAQLMDAQNSKLVIETLEREGVAAPRAAMYDLANVITRQSDEYVAFATKYPKDWNWHVEKMSATVCGIPESVYEKGISKKILDEINARYKEKGAIVKGE